MKTAARLPLVSLLLLGGCAATKPMLHLEPNPATPAEGFGYVDFYVDVPNIPCSWTLTQTRLHRDLWGGSMPTDDRLDSHVYLAEIVDQPHRLVRVESKPGAQHFHIDAKARAFGGKDGYCRSEDVDLIIVEGKIIPVRVNMDSRPGPTLVGEAVDYQRKEAMPYFKPE